MSCFDWLISNHTYRYSVLLLEGDTASGSDEETSHKIITNAKLDGWKTGKTQVITIMMMSSLANHITP